MFSSKMLLWFCHTGIEYSDSGIPIILTAHPEGNMNVRPLFQNTKKQNMKL